MQPAAGLCFSVSPALPPDQLKTYAFTVSEWATKFGINRNRMAKILKGMEAKGHAWRFGSRWRIRLIDAPLEYLVDAELLAPALSPKDARRFLDLLALHNLE